MRDSVPQAMDATQSPETAGGTPPEHVAVVVVHGVADQQPHESARAIAALLSSINEPNDTRYQAFEEDDLRIDVTSPQISEGTSKTFYERAKEMAGARYQVGDGPNAADPGIAMMEEQLRGYQPSAADTTYRSSERLPLRASREGGARHAGTRGSARQLAEHDQ